MSQVDAMIVEINELLDNPVSSCTVLVRKAARLARLSNDTQNELLFSFHLSGIESEGFAAVGKSLTEEQKSRLDIEKVSLALKHDRALGDGGGLQSWPLEELERYIAWFKSLIDQNIDTGGITNIQKPLIVQIELERIVSRIRNRVAAYVRSAEAQHDVEGSAETGGRIFIGHGRSPVWKDLRDFLENRLDLGWDEFNREPQAGINTQERLSSMLDSSCFAFLVFTGEDRHSDGTFHPRENVIHEAGLFQGRLGFRRTIVLLEEGCEKFSNLGGLTEIRFPKANIGAVFEEIRKVLEREGLIS